MISVSYTHLGGANIAGCGTILEECEKRGIKPESLLKEFYEYKASAEQDVYKRQIQTGQKR